MTRSWKLGLIKPSKPRGVELNQLKIGEKFNHLIILKLDHVEWKYNRSNFYYLCQCSCGKEKVIDKNSIRRGVTQSCGCYHRKQNGLAHRKEKYSASMSGIYGLYRIRAKNKSINFELTKEQFKKITSQNCFYCGESPSQYTKSHKHHFYGAYKHNGLDRINSKQGYTIKNVVACCKYCNYAKNDLTTTKFLNHIRKIYEYTKNK
jgi:5-methylcytosine-specific restriction endonuclease McrA